MPHLLVDVVRFGRVAASSSRGHHRPLVVSRLVRHIMSRVGSEHLLAVLPGNEAELSAYLKRLLPAEDWYVGKSPAEANAIDWIVNDIFAHPNPLKPMKLESLGGLGKRRARRLRDRDRYIGVG